MSPITTRSKKTGHFRLRDCVQCGIIQHVSAVHRGCRRMAFPEPATRDSINSRRVYAVRGSQQYFRPQCLQAATSTHSGPITRASAAASTALRPLPLEILRRRGKRPADRDCQAAWVNVSTAFPGESPDPDQGGFFGIRSAGKTNARSVCNIWIAIRLANLSESTVEHRSTSHGFLQSRS